jgi:hypothetical protein
MKRKWNTTTATAFVTKVKNGKLPQGLTYWSAIDYLNNHTSLEVPK